MSLIRPCLDGRRCPALTTPTTSAAPTGTALHSSNLRCRLGGELSVVVSSSPCPPYSPDRRGVELSRSTNRPTPHLGGTSGAFYLPRALDAPGRRRYRTVVSEAPRLTALIHNTGCGHAVAALQTRTMALLQSSGSYAPPSFVQSISRSVFANCSSPRCSRYPPHASTSRVACATY